MKKNIFVLCLFLFLLLCSCSKKEITEGYITDFEEYKNMGALPTSMEIFRENNYGEMESIVITDSELCKEIADMILKNHYTLSEGYPFPGSHTPTVDLHYDTEIYHIPAKYISIDGKRYYGNKSKELSNRLVELYYQYKK